jgi:putative transposase
MENKMARPLRIEYPGAFYHITARGNERKDIFKSIRDREQFLSYLASAAERYQAVFHVYCLMSNHYHLLLETPQGNLSQIMRHINGAYTTYFNTKRRRAGHLFQGRYKTILVEADEYAEVLSRYIHLNPVRAGIVKDPEAYPWSSYEAYIGGKKPPKWLCMDMVLSCFGRKVKETQRRYREFVEAGRESEEDPLRGVVASTILGSSEFVQAIRDKFLANRKAERDVPAVRKLVAAPSPEQIAHAVDGEMSDAALARQVKLYLLQQYTPRTLKDIGKLYGISESGVSTARRRMGQKIRQDARLRKVIEKIKKGLNLSNA